jgi:hypothetical protein
VAISTLVNCVHCIQYLFEEISAHFFIKLSSLSNVVEQLTSFSQIQNEVSLILNRAILLLVVSIQLKLNRVDQIFMHKISHDLSFLLNGFNLFVSLIFVHCVFEDLSGVEFFSVWVLDELNFRASALTQVFDDLILSKEFICWHIIYEFLVSLM